MNSLLILQIVVFLALAASLFIVLLNVDDFESVIDIIDEDRVFIKENKSKIEKKEINFLLSNGSKIHILKKEVINKIANKLFIYSDEEINVLAKSIKIRPNMRVSGRYQNRFIRGKGYTIELVVKYTASNSGEGSIYLDLRSLKRTADAYKSNLCFTDYKSIGKKNSLLISEVKVVRNNFEQMIFSLLKIFKKIFLIIIFITEGSLNGKFHNLIFAYFASVLGLLASIGVTYRKIISLKKNNYKIS